MVNLCTSEHLLVHHPMLEGILLSECERLKQHSLANKLISLFRQFGGTELRLKLVCVTGAQEINVILAPDKAHMRNGIDK